MADPATYRRAGQMITRLFVAGVLLVAAYFKFTQLLTPDIRTGRLWHLLQVQGEFLLAVWLLSGLFRRTAFAVVAACFVAFTVVSLQKAISGATSCGCFGRAEVNPWVTVSLDVVIVVLLLLWFPSGPTRRPRRLLQFILYPSAIVVLLLMTYLGVTYHPGRLLPDGRITGDPRHVELTPDDWVDHAFPLAPYLIDAPDFRTGRWNLMFVRRDCPLCHDALEDLRTQAGTYPDKDLLSRIVIVEVPPDGPFPLLDSLRPTFPPARLRDDRDWTLLTPTVIKLHDGVVTSVASPGRIQLPTTVPSPDGK